EGRDMRRQPAANKEEKNGRERMEEETRAVRDENSQMRRIVARMLEKKDEETDKERKLAEAELKKKTEKRQRGGGTRCSLLCDTLLAVDRYGRGADATSTKASMALRECFNLLTGGEWSESATGPTSRIQFDDAEEESLRVCSKGDSRVVSDGSLFFMMRGFDGFSWEKLGCIVEEHGPCAVAALLGIRTCSASSRRPTRF
ncbi:hypothetical protein PFISCL1PPCAC_3532, partial [Pristionchus fissidentatus]